MSDRIQTTANLKPSDVGRWVKYYPGVGEPEFGRIKSWGPNVVFVVYKCDGKWDNYDEYTAAATWPGDLEFCEKPEGEK